MKTRPVRPSEIRTSSGFRTRAGVPCLLTGSSSGSDDTGGRILGAGDAPLAIIGTGDITIRGSVDESGESGQDGFENPADGGDPSPGGGGGIVSLDASPGGTINAMLGVIDALGQGAMSDMIEVC